MAGVWEEHDKSRFEIFAFDNGGDDGSPTRARITAAMDRVISIRDMSDTQAATAIHGLGVDILVNLNGYFGGERNLVFARRPAPIQVNYLGFPGTLGADYFDYIIADSEVIAPGEEQFYCERVVTLPDSYQANDRNKEIGPEVSRAECGLPEQGFVFCCFNNNYKILPSHFDIWMRILRRVDGSVLWLLEDNGIASKNLRQEASARGVDPARLIFAGRLPLAQHLARHRVADLFLDSLPYNAHTTGSDALWAGLPLLTCRGQTFAGRVGASLLKAIALPELITTTLESYEQLAVQLAHNPQMLGDIRRRLETNRLITPLFDTVAFARNLEAAFGTMVERRNAGIQVNHFAIAGDHLSRWH